MRLRIDDHDVEADAGSTILEAAGRADLYVPRLCWHPDLPPGRTTPLGAKVFQGTTAFAVTGNQRTYEGCGLCVVEVAGFEEPVPACDTQARDGMVVRTSSEALASLRRQSLRRILAEHPHACLTCAQQEGCSRTQCSSNVPENERCCPLLGRCELQKVAVFIGLPEDLPRYRPMGKPVVDGEPLFVRDYNLCVACTRCVRICNDVRGVGALGVVSMEDRPLVGMTAATAAAAGCRFCGACVEVCPTGALTDRNSGASADREARMAPCRSACPAGIDIPRYIRHIAAGRFDEANAVVRERVPFPNVLGHVCFHPCEEVCQRNGINAPVSICSLKRTAAERETGLWKANLARPEPRGVRVGIVGAGPSGLTAAYFLARKGYGVVVYDALPKPGGMLRYGILPYRLPQDVLDREIDEIAAAGVELRTGSRVTLEELLANAFGAVLLTTGAHGGRDLRVDGTDLAWIIQGVHFLRDVALGAATSAEFGGKRAVVIGGGNVAVDAARAMRRLGAVAVDMVCLEQRDEMPAYESEIIDAIDEGLALHNGWGPKRFLGTEVVSSIELRRCVAVFDSEGKFNPRYDDAETMTLAADVVVLAIGQSCELDYLGQSQVRIARDGTIEADESMLTQEAGVFTAGDVRHGPASVIEAIADGRRAAQSIDLYLGGDGCIDEQLIAMDPPDPRLGPAPGFAERTRVVMPVAAMETRTSGFCRVELGYDVEQAMTEAGRCLQCDLRFALHKPEFPPGLWHLLDAAGISLVQPNLEGVYVLADGDKHIVKIKGTATLHADLLADAAQNTEPRYFRFEEDPMYTKRESELLQQYMQEHGRMPGAGADELDDLF